MVRLKKKATCFVSLVLVVVACVYMIMPTAHFVISFGFNEWNARFINNVYFSLRKFIDPAFRDISDPLRRSKYTLDIVMPIVEKDLPSAKIALTQIRAFVMQPIAKIYLVAPESQKIREFAKEMGCQFVLENDVVDDYSSVKKYGGWIIQQLIKFNVDRISNQDNILVIDADTMLLRPQTFISGKDGVYTFAIHTDYSQDRKDFTKAMLKTNTYFKLDFVAHHMIFNRQWLKELKEELAHHSGKLWYKAILDQVDKTGTYGFSEYDLYATFVFLNHRDSVRFLASANVVLFRDKLIYFNQYFPVFAPDYKSASSHHFMLSELDQKVESLE